MRRLSLAAALVATCVLAAPASAQILGPSPYLQFSDSPFFGSSFSYFYLETFEDGLFNTPGVTKIPVGAVIGPSGQTDSVDGDDGAIDGFGTRGSSLFGSSGAFVFDFDAAVLGALPTHVGIVWTDGGNPIFFQAFDQHGVSLGTATGMHADNSISGETAEDRFYGAIHAGGISRIYIENGSGGIEVDHLQYGLAAAPTSSVPEPGSYALLATGLGALVVV